MSSVRARIVAAIKSAAVFGLMLTPLCVLWFLGEVCGAYRVHGRDDHQDEEQPLPGKVYDLATYRQLRRTQHRHRLQKSAPSEVRPWKSKNENIFSLRTMTRSEF